MQTNSWSTEAAVSFRLGSDSCSIERVVSATNGQQCISRLPLLESGNRYKELDLASSFDQSFLRSAQWPTSESTNVAVRLVDLFSGCGLMTLGVWEACRAINRRLIPVLAIDTNPTALNILGNNFPEMQAIASDVTEFLDQPTGAKLSTKERGLAKRVGNIDLVVGGPPCQGHSNLNNHTRRFDPKNRLYERMGRFAEVVSPQHIIIENVPAVLHDRWRAVESTMNHLTSLGYAVDHGVIEMSTLGVPQRRKRHVVVGSQSKTPCLESMLSAHLTDRRGVSWAIDDLLSLDETKAFDKASEPTQTNQRRIDYLFDNDMFDLPNELRPDCHRLNPQHSYKSSYGRMRWNEPAQTITSGFGSMGQGRFVHPERRRTLTAHEAARLQFVPDFFQFNETVRKSALAEIIGNGVPVKLTYVLALELLR